MTRLRTIVPGLLLLVATPHQSLAVDANLAGSQLQVPINLNTDTMSSQLPELFFRRIRVTTQEDINRLYPVLAAYIQNPDLASSVTELVIDVEAWPKYFYRNLRPAPQTPTPAPGPEEVAAHARIEAYVRNLGLDDTMTQSMLQSLAWKFDGEPESGNSDDVYAAYGTNSTRGFAGAASAILLSLCRNVELLYAYGLEGSAPVREFLLRNNYGKLPAAHLQKLQKLQIQSWYAADNREYDRLEFLDYFRFFGKLPALRTYSADAVIEYQAERGSAPPGSSHGIREISITNSDLSGGMIGTIIRVPRALEEFTLSLGGLSHFEGGGPVVPPKTVGKCLLEHKGTLRMLDLDLAIALGGGLPEEEEGFGENDEDDEDEDEDEDEDGDKDDYFLLDEQAGNGGPLHSTDLPDTRKYGRTIGSLHDFEALEHLAISVRLMLGPVVYPETRSSGSDTALPFRLVDALPKNLKSLHLYDYVKGECPQADEHVDELKLKLAGRFPLLKEVRGLDEPLIKNSKYDENCGYDEEDPPELAVLRLQNRGLDWESV